VARLAAAMEDGAVVQPSAVETPSFSFGGLSGSVRVEHGRLSGSTDPAAGPGYWQPFAASALASLVRRRCPFSSKPAAGGGLLDLPASSPDLATANSLTLDGGLSVGLGC